jgi:hypothetical protein
MVLGEDLWEGSQFLYDMLTPTCELIKAIQSDKANLAGVCLYVCVCAPAHAHALARKD